MLSLMPALEETTAEPPAPPPGPKVALVGFEMRIQRLLPWSLEREVVVLHRVEWRPPTPHDAKPRIRAHRPRDPGPQVEIAWPTLPVPERVFPQFPGRTRPVTVSSRRLNRREREEQALREFLDPHWDRDRPRVLGDCEPGGKNEARPCPWVSCRYHLAIETNEENGSIKYVFPNRELEDMPFTCAFDAIAARGPQHLKQVAMLLGVTHERVQQVAAKGLQEGLVKIRRVTK